MKKESGITLIALIITIIVLLILAGVSISLVVGQNGVVGKAQNAVEATKKAIIEEQLALAWAACETEYLTYGNGQNKSDYFTKEELNKNLSEGSITGISFETTGDSELVYKLGDLYYKMKVTESGEVRSEGVPSSDGVVLTLASQIDASNYGDYVDYKVDLEISNAENNELSDGTNPQTDWRIFYEDENNVYLIASSYLPSSKLPSGVFEADNGLYNVWWAHGSEDAAKLTTSGNITTNNSFLFTKLSNITTENHNYQAATTLLDSEKWSVFAKEGYVDNVNTSVIGSPTVEMWISSWNERYSDTLAFDSDSLGYKVGFSENSISKYLSNEDMQKKEGYNNTLYYPHADIPGDGWNGTNGYYLASPSANHENYIMLVSCRGSLNYYRCTDGIFGVRPVVALQSGIKAQKVDGVWQLENKDI